jgi:hypothetical protein
MFETLSWAPSIFSYQEAKLILIASSNLWDIIMSIIHQILLIKKVRLVVSIIIIRSFQTFLSWAPSNYDYQEDKLALLALSSDPSSFETHQEAYLWASLSSILARSDLLHKTDDFRSLQNPQTVSCFPSTNGKKHALFFPCSPTAAGGAQAMKLQKNGYLCPHLEVQGVFNPILSLR